MADIDEVDLALINTLQLAPRASWTDVGRALQLDPVTVARRWERLSGSGAAWITAQPTGVGCAAMVEVTCHGNLQETATSMARWPHALTIEFTSGSRDLLVTLGAPDLPTMSQLVVDQIGRLPGVGSTRTHLITHVYAYGGDWRIGALDRQQQASLPARARRDLVPRRAHTSSERAMLAVLSQDGRASYTTLAAEMGCSQSTARRRLQTMIEDGLVRLRCDLAQPLSGSPVTVWLWANVPPDRADRTARAIARLPEARACLGLTGGSGNFLYCAWLHSLADAQRHEQHLATAVPGLTIVDRAVALAFEKRMGQLLDRRGRRVGCVPMDLWAPARGTVTRTDSARYLS